MTRDRPPGRFLRALPGQLAAALLALATSLWTLWSFSTLYYQSWSLPLADLLRALAPAPAAVVIAYLALAWPRVGGWVLAIAGVAFTALWWGLAIATGAFGLGWVLGTFPVSGLFVLIGLLLVAEARHRRLRQAEGWERPPQWWRRIGGRVAVVAFPALVATAVTLVYVPMITGRVDDGNRGARVIRGNGVTLEWAPAGPGWNARLPGGARPSWNDLARYGLPPIGLAKDPGTAPAGNADAATLAANGVCSFLTADGAALAAESPHIWRLPTSDEIAASLVAGGSSAGCVWHTGDSVATCDRTPNKGTPLWAPNETAIAYLGADEATPDDAWAVPYSGGGTWGGSIHAQPKSWRDPQVGFRCVRDVAP